MWCEWESHSTWYSASPPYTRWLDFDSWVQFELADFLFEDIQMLGRRINRLIEIWAADNLKHGNLLPLMDHGNIYDSIDSIHWETHYINGGHFKLNILATSLLIILVGHLTNIWSWEQAGNKLCIYLSNWSCLWLMLLVSMIGHII